MKASDVEKEIKGSADMVAAKSAQIFFKTGKGGYAAGDIFLGGLTVPEQRQIARKYQELSFLEVKKLLWSRYHELRFIALEILVFKYEEADIAMKKQIVDFYLANKERVNNWDLVDTSASYILGDWLRDKPRDILYKLTKSQSLWDRRIAVVATCSLIRNCEYKDTLKLCEFLLKDKEDLMHKACGWMLREVGKKSEVDLCRFLDRFCTKMPRTMLRYAIERFPEKRRKSYLLAK